MLCSHQALRSLGGQKSITFKELITAFLTLQASRWQRADLNCSWFESALDFFLRYSWGWNTGVSDVLSLNGDMTYTNSHISYSDTSTDFYEHGFDILQLQFQFNIRFLSLEAENLQTPELTAPGIRILRECGRFLRLDGPKPRDLLLEVRRSMIAFLYSDRKAVYY